MLNLLGKVSFDASGFTQAMSKMKSSAGPAGKEIGQQIRGKMLEAFGAGAAIALFKNTIKNALDIRKGATSSGLDTSTFQVLKRISDESGASIEDLSKALDDAAPASDELRNAIAAARDEMERTGQIIDSETVDQLAKLSDQMQELFGRLAPGLAMLVGFLASLYEITSKFVQLNTAALITAIGVRYFNKNLIQTGVELGSEAFVKSDPEGESALRRASNIAAASSRDNKNKEAGQSRSSGDKSPQVSSLVAAGAIFNRSLGPDNPQQKTLDTMKNEIARIRSIIEKGGI